MYDELGILSDSVDRYRESEEFLTRLRELHTSIRARYAEEFADAGLLRRLVLQWRIAAEFRKDRRKFDASPEAL